MKIPFNKPFIAGKELFYVAQAVLSGHLSGDGDFTKLCHTWLEERYRARKALLTHSCTAALEMAALLANVGPGDQIILPSFTFVSTANAFALRGASIVYADIRADTFNIDETKIADLITPMTKVIVPVHYGGVGCEMDVILDIAKENNCLVVEDAAQGVNASWKGQWLGTLGDFGCYSFHETKNFISGEGGALLINKEEFCARAEVIREKGTNRSQFFRGEVDKYTWVDLGSSFLPSELIAAFLYAQLEEAENISSERLKIHNRYTLCFEDLIAKGCISTQYIPSYCEHNGHLFPILTKSLEERTQLIDYLRKNDVLSVFHYVPLHLSPMGKKYLQPISDLRITESIADRLVRLPCFFGLTGKDQYRVIQLVRKFYGFSD